MFRLETDKGAYKPAKEVKCPYWAETDIGRIVLVKGNNTDGKTARAVVIKQYSEKDPYGVGYEMKALELTDVTPLAEGESLSITNTWEIANG